MKVSVCMATYNGEQYVRRQIESILPQLLPVDELVIVDDCSTDSTFDILKKIRNENSKIKIKIYRNSRNEGFLISFQKSIFLASGDVVFLSDQDDIWFGNKVNKVKQLFFHKNVDIIFHDAVVVDKKGEILFSSMTDLYHISTNPIKNFVKNTVTGCCMAFRRTAIGQLFPIPANAIYHDRWIAIMSKFYGLKIEFFPEALVYHVSHGNNVSLRGKNSLFFITVDRIKLLKEIVKCALRSLSQK